MRVALVHDWLTGMRGGEKVLEGIASLYPRAEIFTLFHQKGSVSQAIESHPIHTSFVQHVPGGQVHFRKLLPLFPSAIERFEFGGFDVVISSSHCVAKGAVAPRGVPHVCYCHTPMRYAWTAYDAYVGRGRAPLPVRLAFSSFVGYLRRWDVASSERVGVFVANSQNVAGRIREIYQRESRVLHPWVDHEFFTPGGPIGEEFLVVTALVPYKRVDVVVEAFRRLGLPLVVTGAGPMLAHLARDAPPNVRFVGHVTDDALRSLYRRARALIFPADEDFGIVPLEAMASGRPVIAYRSGGALETLVEGVTGVFVDDQTPAAFEAAVRAFDPSAFEPERIRTHAMSFDRSVFLDRFAAIVDEAVREDGTARGSGALT